MDNYLFTSNRSFKVQIGDKKDWRYKRLYEYYMYPFLCFDNQQNTGFYQ